MENESTKKNWFCSYLYGDIRFEKSKEPGNKQNKQM